MAGRPDDAAGLGEGDTKPREHPAHSTIPGPKGEHIGDDVGPYHLLDVLGEGGFGVVFLAERRVPIVQRVALKIIRPGMDSRAVIARFEQERQALAMLDHRGIAKVYDAGTTALGRPYFAMELVSGQNLKDFAGSKGLSLRARLELMAMVCHAVAHAHAHGMVHRDLKPSNILVAEQDGTPVPKVIDFGVVKALQAIPADKTVYTHEGMAIGTPEYMSPEQAGAPGTDVDPRADVYSLGVVMFELLTSSMPYDVSKIRSAAQSRSLSKVIEALQVRRAGSLDPSLRGDVEIIIQKAMHKDRTRRYATAGELGDDIERYLKGDPIAARRDSLVYVARMRLRQAAQKAPISIYLVSWVTTLLLMSYVIEPVLDRTPSLMGWTDRLAAWAADKVSPPPPLERVKVIALTDNATPEELGVLANISGVRNDDAKSLRRIHGAALKRLAAAHPAGVVVDIQFAVNSDHDAALAEGFAALDREHVPWATDLPTWPLGENGPRISESLRIEPPRYGASTMDLNQGWAFVDLAAQRGGGEVMPSLAVFALAESKRPGLRFDLALNQADRQLVIVYWRSDPKAPGVHTQVGDPEKVPLTSLQEVTQGDKTGMQSGDLRAMCNFRVSSDDELARNTIAYAQALREDDAEIERLVAGKWVVIGDMRTASGDFHKVPDGRTVGGPQMVAAAIDQLLAGRTVLAPDEFARLWMLAGAAATGAIIAGLGLRHVGRRWISLLAMAGLVVGTSVLSYPLLGYLFNPIPVLLAMLVASELCTTAALAVFGRNNKLEREKGL